MSKEDDELRSLYAERESDAMRYRVMNYKGEGRSLLGAVVITLTLTFILKLLGVPMDFYSWKTYVGITIMMLVVIVL